MSALLAQNAAELLHLYLYKTTVVHKLSNTEDHKVKLNFVNWYLQRLHGGKIVSTLILFSNYDYFDLKRVSAQSNPLQFLLNFVRIKNSSNKTK